MAYGDPTMYKGYLGGHNWITHVDEGALKYFRDELNVKTMVDVGCGPGGQVRAAISLGLDAVGIDGDPRVIAESKDITIHECDYTKETHEVNVDLVWSTEFVEHVKEEYQDNYMKTFAGGKHVFITFAPPGKGGNHHVNLKPSSYWIEVFERYGFQHDLTITSAVRNASTMKREFVRNNGLYFVKK